MLCCHRFCLLPQGTQLNRAGLTQPEGWIKGPRKPVGGELVDASHRGRGGIVEGEDASRPVQVHPHLAAFIMWTLPHLVDMIDYKILALLGKTPGLLILSEVRFRAVTFPRHVSVHHTHCNIKTMTPLHHPVVGSSQQLPAQNLRLMVKPL